MTIIDRDAPVRGVFVMLDGVRHEFPKANCWRSRHPDAGITVGRDWVLGIARAFAVHAEFGRFDMVGYMREAA